MATTGDTLIRQPINLVGSTLVKSVIARPLLERIRRELQITAEMRKNHPALAKKHSTAVFLNPHFHAGLDAARKAVLSMVARFEAAQPAAPRTTLDCSAAPDMLLGSPPPDVVEHLLSMNEALSNPILQIWPSRWDVIIDVNLKFRERSDSGGQEAAAGNAKAGRRDAPSNADPRLAAKRAIAQYITRAKRSCRVTDRLQQIDTNKTELSNQYVFARLEGKVLLRLVEIDKEEGEHMAGPPGRRQGPAAQDSTQTAAQDPRSNQVEVSLEQPGPWTYRAIYQIWPDFDLHSCTHRSVRTVKADAAQNSFSAYGEGITWAVVDSGIDWRHPHFAMHANIDPYSPFHRDFTRPDHASPLSDEKGHGTHVAAIIAGQQSRAAEPAVPPAPPYDQAWRLRFIERERDPRSTDDDTYVAMPGKPLAGIGGIAPRCKLVSLKVLDQFGAGKASNVIAAIAHIQLINGHGRDLKIHGVNLSLGHSFDANWFACGHSPLCVEVNRLVKSGVVVVVAAGNTGYGVLKSVEGDRNSGLDLSINDPGNAELAITVGATHRESPHTYGVSYFSSKGPTGDGRCKPDLLAPGERIVSAAAAGSSLVKEFGADQPFAYCESSGTSMAAPHVSGAVAAFLSIRNEFIGEAEKIKKIFTQSATDLGRERYFQGAGLLDLLRAIQSV